MYNRTSTGSPGLGGTSTLGTTPGDYGILSSRLPSIGTLIESQVNDKLWAGDVRTSE